MTKPFPDISEIFSYEYLGDKPEKGGHQIKIKHEELKAILEFFYRDSRFWCDYLISISGQHKTVTPEQRNLLLPSNWKGFPLRKNYVEQEVFHGIKVKF